MKSETTDGRRWCGAQWMPAEREATTCYATATDAGAWLRAQGWQRLGFGSDEAWRRARMGVSPDGR